MKNLILIGSFLVFAFTSKAQSLQPIYNAIGSGDATALTSYLNNELELCIFNQEDVFSKAVAINKLKAFFEDYSPKSISEIHKSSSKGKGSFFTHSNLKTSKGNIRVYIYFRKTDSDLKIEELRFDKKG